MAVKDNKICAGHFQLPVYTVLFIACVYAPKLTSQDTPMV